MNSSPIHPSLEQWLINAYGLTGQEKNYGDLSDDEKLEAIGCHIFALPRSGTIIDVMSEVKRSYSSFKILQKTKSLESIVELFLFHAVSENCPSREAYLHSILQMDAEAQEYIMQTIKDYAEMIEAGKIAAEADPADDDDATKFCKYCAIKDQYIVELRHKLVEDLSPAYSFETALQDGAVEAVNSQEHYEETIAQLKEKIATLNDELDYSNRKLSNVDLAILGREEIIAKLEDELNELQFQAEESSHSFTKLSEKLRAAEDEVELLKPSAEKVALLEAQLDRLKDKLITFNEMKRQLKEEETNHAATFAKLVDCQNELDEFKSRCAQLEDYRSQCADCNVLIEELKLQLSDRDDDILKLKGEKMAIDREAKDTAFRLQLLEAEQIVLSERLSTFEHAAVGSTSAISEVNPMMMNELKKLRVENKDLRERVMQTSAKEYERLEKELADQRQMSSEMRERWLSAKESHDFLKLKLDNVSGFDGNHEQGENGDHLQYEKELIRVKSKLLDAEVKLESFKQEKGPQHSSEMAKKNDYLIMELRTKLADAENKINELMDTNRLQETILNSSKEEGLIATRRAHEIEINGLKTALAEAQSKVNDLTVANKVQETVLKGNAAEHNEMRKVLELEINHLRSASAEFQSKINELSVINKVQESALASNKEEIANLKKQYEMETNHLKAVYAEAKAKIAELNDSIKVLSSSRGYNAEEERARRVMEEEIAELKSALQSAQSKVNELLVSNKVLESTLSVAKDDLINYKDVAQQEILTLKDALSATQTKVNELSVSNKVNENSSKLNESTVENLRHELEDSKKYYDSELRKTKKALQDAQNKIHELIQEQMTHETDTKPSGADQELISIVKGHFESEINQLKASLSVAQERINELDVANRVQDHALTAAKEELAIAKQQHEVDLSQAKFTLEVANNTIRVLEDTNHRQVETLKGLLDTKSGANDEKTQAQDASRSYFEEEINRLKSSLTEAQAKLDRLSLAAIEKDSKIREFILENKIQENALNSAKEKFDEFKAHSDSEIAALKFQLSQTQSKLNEAAVSNKVQESVISNLKLEMEANRKRFEEDFKSAQAELDEAKHSLAEATEINRRYELETNSAFFEEEISRLKRELAETQEKLYSVLMDRSVVTNEGAKEVIVSGLSDELQKQLEDEISSLESQIGELQQENNDLRISTAALENSLRIKTIEIESLKAKAIEDEKKEIKKLQSQLKKAVEDLKQKESLITSLRTDVLGLQTSLQIEQKRRTDTESALDLAKHEVAGLQFQLEHNKGHSHKSDEAEEGEVVDEDILTLQSSLADAQNKVDHLSKELLQLEKRSIELECEGEIQRNHLQNAQEQLADLKTRSESEINDLQSHIAASKAAVSELTIAAAVQEEKLNKALSDIASLQAELKTAKASNEEAKKALEPLIIENKVRLAQSEAALKEASELKAALNESNQKLSELLQSPSIDPSTGESQAKISELLTAVKILEENVKDLQSELAQVKGDARKQIAELQQRVIDLSISEQVLQDSVNRGKEELAEAKHRAEVDFIHSESAKLESANTINMMIAKEKALQAELKAAVDEIKALKESSLSSPVDSTPSNDIRIDSKQVSCDCSQFIINWMPKL